MFKSYLFIYISLPDNPPLYELTIIDSDFQEIIQTNNKYSAENIIEVYSRRSLNVALNLFLYMQYRNKEYGDSYSIDYQISWYKKDIKDFDKYLPEINKYLSLL